MMAMIQKQLIDALHIIRQEIRWKPGKDRQHLETRKAWGHLPEAATIADYHAIIQTILATPTAQVYLYSFNQIAYPTIVAEYEGNVWLVMFSMEAVMETAFVVAQPEKYLAKKQFTYLGILAEVEQNEPK